MKRFVAVLSVFAFAGSLLVGCGGGDGANKFAVSGTVKFKGAPLAAGTIQFFPEDAAKSPTSGGSAIENGAYRLSGKDGLAPGMYIVRISSQQSKAKQEEVPGDSDAASFKELIPAAFNSATKLKFEVKASGSNVLDVDIPAK